MRRVWVQGILLLLLVFAQHESLAHQISHAAQQAAQQDPARESTKPCDKCLTLAHLGDSPPASSLILVCNSAELRATLTRACAERSTTFCAYRSRAPPPTR